MGVNKVYTYNKIVPETTTTISQDEFKLISDNKFVKWIIGIMLKYKLIENTTIKQVKYNRVSVDFYKVSQLLDNLIMDKMYHKCMSGKDFYIVIGWNYFKALEIECYEQMKFIMPVNVGGREGTYKGNVLLVLEPGIDGVFLLDK